MKREKARRVYFIGAGFSAPLGYPVGSLLPVEVICRLRGLPACWPLRGRELQNSLRTTPADQDQCDDVLVEIEKFLRQFFGIRANVRRASRSHVQSIFRNISVAEFYSVAHALADTPGIFGAGHHRRRRKSQKSQETPTPTSLYETLSAVTRTFFIDVSKTNKPARELRSLVQDLEPNRDVLVSFNWDQEVDFCVSSRADKMGDDYDLVYTAQALEPQYQFVLLKPHGSIDWYDVSLGIGNYDQYFVADGDCRIPRDARRLLTYFDNDLPDDIDDSPHSTFTCAPVIMPPTFAKRFRYVEQQCIWQDVLRVCAEATDFVFLGYSLPRDDYLTRAAIRSSLSAKKAAERGKVRCLIVTRPLAPDKARPPVESDPLLRNFQEVFGPTITREKNVLPWEFGQTRGDFVAHISDRLRRATCR